MAMLPSSSTGVMLPMDGSPSVATSYLIETSMFEAVVAARGGAAHALVKQIEKQMKNKQIIKFQI